MRAPFVCFAGETALRIARASSGNLRVVRRSVVLPASMPKKSELDDACSKLVRMFPDLDLDRPLRIVTGATNQRRSATGYHATFSARTFPSRSFLRVDEGIYVAAPPLALMQIAAREPRFIELLEWAWELCSTYQTARTASGTRYQVAPLTSAQEIRSYVKNTAGFAGAKRLAKITAFLADGSASPRETKLALMLGLPMSRGGYGLGLPFMNYRVKADAGSRAISGRSEFACDLCWPNAKLDVEYQSTEIHRSEESRLRDSRRANALASMGWTVIGVTSSELDSMIALEVIVRAIRKTIGKRDRTRVARYSSKKWELRRRLGLGIGLDEW